MHWHQPDRTCLHAVLQDCTRLGRARHSAGCGTEPRTEGGHIMPAQGHTVPSPHRLRFCLARNRCICFHSSGAVCSGTFSCVSQLLPSEPDRTLHLLDTADAAAIHNACCGGTCACACCRADQCMAPLLASASSCGATHFCAQSAEQCFEMACVHVLSCIHKVL